MNHKRLYSVVLCLLLMVLLIGTVSNSSAQDQVIVTLSGLDVGVAESGVIEGQITCAVGGCGSFKISISFDRNLLRVEKAEVGPYLGSQVFEGENTVDNAAGKIRLEAAAMSTPPADAETVLFRLTVSGQTVGSTTLTIDELEITDLSSNPVMSSGQAGIITVYETDKIPFFSPPSNGWEVAFVSERDGNPEIYAMNANGGNVRRLTNNPALDGTPAWSPNGSQIAFSSMRDGNSEIYVMNADGSAVQRLTNDPADDTYPAWAPNGSLAFVSERDGNAEIYVMNADGSAVQRLTNDPAMDTYPAWAPNGSQIAFSSAREGTAEIHVMNADGSAVQRLTSLFGTNGWYPAWTPNGNTLSFTAERDAQADIYAMSRTGENPQRLNEFSSSLTETDWSPDSNWLAFMAGYDGNDDLYVTSADGSRLFRLTESTSRDYAPDWRSVAPLLPCLIRTDKEDVPLHVGPGRNRGIYAYLPSNQDFRVIGQALDDQEDVWWRLEKEQITDDPGVNELWVAAEDVEEKGDCGSVETVDPPPIIIPRPTPVPTLPPPPPPPPGITPPPPPGITPPPPPQVTCYTLAASVTPAQYGSIAFMRPNCPTGGGAYLAGTVVTITVYPAAPAYYVNYWTGSCPGVPASGYLVNTINVTMNYDCSATAHLSYIG